MILPHHIVLAIGLLLPAISWITLGLSVYDWHRHRRNSSPVFIPVIGPLIVSGWIVATHRSPLWIPLAWIADIGTLAYLRASPRIVRELWDTSRWTQTQEFRANHGEWTATLTLHSTGAYHLRYSRDSVGLGLKEQSIAGKYTREGDEIHLLAVRGENHDLKLVRERGGRYRAALDRNWSDPETASESGRFFDNSSWFFEQV
jgi:hypothetical protein